MMKLVDSSVNLEDKNSRSAQGHPKVILKNRKKRSRAYQIISKISSLRNKYPLNYALKSIILTDVKNKKKFVGIGCIMAE